MQLTTYIWKISSNVWFCMGMTKRHKPHDDANMTVGNSRLNNYTDLHLEFLHPWLVPAFNVWGNKHIILYGTRQTQKLNPLPVLRPLSNNYHPSQFSHKFEYLLRNLTYIIELVKLLNLLDKAFELWWFWLIRPLSCEVGAVMWRLVWVVGRGVIDTTSMVWKVVVCDGVYVVGAVVGVWGRDDFDGGCIFSGIVYVCMWYELFSHDVMCNTSPRNMHLPSL